MTKARDLSILTGYFKVVGDKLELNNITEKLDAVTAPTTTDDSTAGYEIGARWVDPFLNVLKR